MSSETLAAPAGLEPTSCGLCGADEAEPVAVGEDFRGRSSRDTYLAVRCSSCGLIYLTPAPIASLLASVHESAGEPEAGPLCLGARRALRRSVERWARGLPTDAKVLVLSAHEDHDQGWIADVTRRDVVVRSPEKVATEPERSYDGALLVGVLESMADPVELLSRLARVLRSDGRILVISTNPDSLAAGAFRGRHWSGYDFPRRRALADSATMRRLVARAGLHLESARTLGDPSAWTVSAATLLRDWEASPWLIHAVGPSSWPARLLAGALETASVWGGKGGLLESVLRPATTATASG